MSDHGVVLVIRKSSVVKSTNILLKSETQKNLMRKKLLRTDARALELYVHLRLRSISYVRNLEKYIFRGAR